MALVLTSNPSESVEVVARPLTGWVKDPTRPELNTPIDLQVDADRARPRTQGVFAVLGSDEEIVVSDTRRRLQHGSITFLEPSMTDVRALDELWDTGNTLLVQLPGPTGGVGENLWVQIVGDVSISRLAQVGDADDRNITVSFVEQRPV